MPVQILGSYFLLLPIRDEAGVSLGLHPSSGCLLATADLVSCMLTSLTCHAGTQQLPYLFVGSFLLTLIGVPLVSQFLVRPGVTP